MRVVIVDDERLAREELKSMLAKFPNIEIVAEAKNASEGIVKINEFEPDLVFTDIQMPGMDGFEMFKKLDEIPKVVFISAFDEYALKAFEINALDYLVKPIDPKRLEEAIQKLSQPDDEILTKLAGPITQQNKILTKGDKVFIKDGEKCWFIDVNTIRMFESDGNYVKVYFEKFRPLILRSLNGLEERLDAKHFFRANRKFIINLNCITHVENWFNGGLMVVLNDNDNEKIEISRRQAIRFKELMSI